MTSETSSSPMAPPLRRKDATSRRSPSWPSRRARETTSSTNIAKATCNAKFMNEDERKFESKEPRESRQHDGVSEISRRDWLLSLGSAVILSGFSGMPGEPNQSAYTPR